MENEPVCWNCAKANRIRNESNEVLFYEPCDLYRLKMECKYVPVEEINCSNCQHFDIEAEVCEYGVEFMSPRCYFKIKDKTRQLSLDVAQNARKDICYVCPFRRTFVDNINSKCSDCPVDWRKFGIKF